MKSKPPFRASSDQSHHLVGRNLTGTQGEAAATASAGNDGADKNGIKFQAVNIRVEMNNSSPGDLLKLAAIVQSSSDAILSTDINGAITSWNPAAEQLFGYPAEDALGQPISILIPLQSREDEEHVSACICAGEKLPPIETTRRHKDGTVINVSLSISILRDEAGKVLGLSQIARETLSKKRLQEELRERNERLTAALVASGTGTFRWNIHTDELDWDDSLHRLFGHNPRVGIQTLSSFLEAVHPDDRAHVKSACAQCIEEGCDFNMEFRVTWPNGSIHWVSDRGKTVLDEAGQPAYLVGACVDVTERRRYESQLLNQRDILRSIADGAPLEDVLESLTQAIQRGAERPIIATVLLMSTDGRHLFPAAGRSAPEGWTRLIQKLEIGPSMGSCGTAAFRRERVIVTDTQNDPRWAPLKNEAAAFGLRACWSSPIMSSHGQVLGTFAVYNHVPTEPTELELHIVDVLTGTAAIAIERKRAEDALRLAHASLKEQAQELQGVSDAVPALIAFLDRDRRFQFCNRTFSEWTRHSCEEILGRFIWEIVPPESWKEIEPKIEKALHGATVEFDLETKNSPEMRWVHVIYTPRRDAAGNILGVIIFLNNITSIRQAESALRESENRFRTMADNISQFAWMADASGSIFWYNQRWFDYTGTTLEEMQGWGWTKAHHPDHVDRVVNHIQESWDKGMLWEDTFPLRSSTGEYRWFLSRARPIRDAEGKVLLWFGTNTDVTEQRETALELARTKTELERLNNELEMQVEQRTLSLQETMGELESISYSIVHDLRAPLRTLQGFSHIVLDDFGKDLNAEARSYLTSIATAANRMDRMVRDVLNYSKTVRRGLTLEPVDPGQLLCQIVESYPTFAEVHDAISIEGKFPLVSANPAALTQCFSSLLSNALKFVDGNTPPRVRVWAEELGNEVRINFQDNGIGIAHDQREKIFDLFQQLNKTHGGTGMGLPIVRKAATRMGGRVGVESEPGKGSRFWLDLKRSN